MVDKTMRGRFLAAAGSVPSEVVEFMGEKVEVRGMTVGEANKFLRSVSRTTPTGDTEVDQERFQPALIVASLFDPESGDRIFEDTDVAAVNTMDAQKVQSVVRTAMRLSGFAGGDLGKSDEIPAVSGS